jgi:hypothetical protein
LYLCNYKCDLNKSKCPLSYFTKGVHFCPILQIVQKVILVNQTSQNKHIISKARAFSQIDQLLNQNEQMYQIGQVEKPCIC